MKTILLLALCAAAAARPCTAQAVSATSGSPEAIARIRAEFVAIEREVPDYRRTVHNVWDFSLEGGTLTGFYRGGELRKLHAHLHGETWQGTEEFYFADGQLVFVYFVTGRYDMPMSGNVTTQTEHRLYFDQGRLIRHIRTQTPASADVPEDDLELAAVLRNARLFAACAAAPSPEAAECTAPER